MVCLSDREKFFEDMFIHFERIHKRDEWMDRWTDTAGWHKLNFCTALCGKNCLHSLYQVPVPQTEHRLLLVYIKFHYFDKADRNCFIMPLH